MSNILYICLAVHYRDMGNSNLVIINGYNYESITLGVGVRHAGPMYAINVTSKFGYWRNGSVARALNNRTVPQLSSLATEAAKCFAYNMTAYPQVNRFAVKIEYYQMLHTGMHGFLVLPKKARGSGKCFLSFSVYCLYLRYDSVLVFNLFEFLSSVGCVVDPYPHHFGNLDPHQIKIRSASNKNPDPDPFQSDKLDLEPDPDPHQFADDKPKCMKYELI